MTRFFDIKALSSAGVSLGKDVVTQVKSSRLRRMASHHKIVSEKILPLTREYFMTSEKGIFSAGPNGIKKVMNVPLYGLAFSGDAFFMAAQLGTRSLLLKGRRAALDSPDENFDLKIVCDIRTPSTNERIHQVTAGARKIWAANTGRNSILEIDPESAQVISEIFPFTDRFGEIITGDHNHINSVHAYGDFLLFTAYRAGKGSLIGIIHEGMVTGYAHPNPGVHDIYLTPAGFVFCDTFGPDQKTGGGSPYTESGRLAPEVFDNGPGYIVRGVASCAEETLIGHSHKGVRAKRFKGKGAILIWNDMEYKGAYTFPAAQIYQIVRSDGCNFDVDGDAFSAEAVKALLETALGKPVYKEQAVRVEGGTV